MINKFWLCFICLCVIVFVISCSPKTMQLPAQEITPLMDTQTPDPKLSLEIGSTKTSLNDGMPMVYVPKGEFTMGSPFGVGNTVERPPHSVYLDAFWIDMYEVTNEKYEQCVNSGACTPPSSNNSFTREEYFGTLEFANYPVIFVTWYQAKAYCEWAGRQLPTEAQWEMAASGTGDQIYPWGNDDPSGNFANLADINTNLDWADKTINDGYGDTAPVGSYPDGISPYGAYDMAGNVYEWTADWFQIYPNSRVINPVGPENGTAKIFRGGSWNDNGFDLRSVSRYQEYPDVTINDGGFRCASQID